MARIKTFEKAKYERFARFSLWPAIAGPKSQFRPSKEGFTSLTTGTYLDSLMAEIPGNLMSAVLCVYVLTVCV